MAAAPMPTNPISPDDEPYARVPVRRLRMLEALEQHASPETLEQAEAQAAVEELDEWEAAGRPGALSHEEFMIELFGIVE